MTTDAIKILDHGYVQLVESWGSDERIIESARMSTGKGFIGWGPLHAAACARSVAIADCVFNYGPDRDAADATACTCEPKPGDEKLLRYLYENKHSTPFEMAGMVIEVKAPIFVFREWHRHRTQSYNEMSARYMPLPDENYIPTAERVMMGGGHLTKQAGTADGASTIDAITAENYRQILEQQYVNDQDFYELALGSGVPKELARLHLPVGRYSRMRASSNLRNWLGFLTLRMAPMAQWEIRQYANAVGALISRAFPRTWELFSEGKS